ncbi:F-box/WD repeat-containing protein 7-like [Oscarella lobularis]|uniref:F-box/WD repeat-containing protein 7-like n=1 Tax=Oscarella lobularis TaxID=121494 RepID=UPI003313F2A3
MEKLDINAASPDQLIAVTGMKPARALAIVDYRERNGPFGEIVDLMKVQGVTRTFVDSIRMYFRSENKREMTPRQLRARRRNAHRELEFTGTPDAETPEGGDSGSPTWMVATATGSNWRRKRDLSPVDSPCSDSEKKRNRLESTGSFTGPSLSFSVPMTPLKKRCTVPLAENAETWFRMFNEWTREQRRTALDELVNRCDASLQRFLLGIIEPQFQRDFISLLPKELAFIVLSYLEPDDLLRAAQTCRYWKALCDDNLLWKEKCRLHNIDSSIMNKTTSRRKLIVKSWKQVYLTKSRIEWNWQHGALKNPKILKGHDDHVITCLKFHGNKIVSGSDDTTLKIWSALTGKQLRTLTGHTGGVWCAQFDGNTIVSGSTDRTLKVWNGETGNCIHTLHGHSSTVRCMAMHGQTVVSGSRDATLRVWDIVTSQCTHVLVGHMAAVRCVQYDGKKVVSGSYDYTVKVWDPESEQCLHTLQGHTNRVYSLQFDGVHIVSGSLDTSIRVWNAESGNCVHTLVGHQSLTSGMELKNNILVSGNADSTVKVWNINTGYCLHTLQGSNKHHSAVTSLQFSENFVVTSSDDGTVKLWDIKTGEFIRNLVQLDSGGSGGVVWRVQCSDKKLVCAVGSRNGTEDTKLLVLDFDV